ncbi:hypothetical protein DB347_08560 [Opitutaceae bacterium EW11]|nr:hypothetical protein DB347_08560 [Opitutaceae bacterium EW11]
MEPPKPLRAEVLPGVWIDHRRALFVDAHRTLVVADIHWGYSAAHRAAGNLLPVWGDNEIASALWSLIEDYRPDEMIWLGDCLHAVAGRESAESFLAEATKRGLAVTVLAGNHDRLWKVPTSTDARRGQFYFHHGDRRASSLPPDAIEVLGHFHPAAGLSDGAGARLRLPALVASLRRVILPAFSPWAAGAVWNRQLQPGEKLWAVAPSRVFEVKLPRPQASAATK